MDESDGHWVSVELASVCGDGCLDHADDCEDIDEYWEEDNSDATGDEPDGNDEDGVEDEGDLEVDCFTPVVVEEG